MKTIKKFLIFITTFTLIFQLVGAFQIKNTYALDTLEILGEKVDFYIEETPFKTIYRAVMEDGHEYISEYDKNTGKVYMNNHEVEYSFSEGKKVLEENELINDNSIELYATDPWTPKTVVTGYTVDFAPLIDGAATVAAIGTQLYTAMIGVGASTLINKLAKATLKQHWAIVADAVGNSILDLIGENASKIVNVTFSYDLQMTSGLVDLMGNGVKVTAYRYANYTGIIKLLGKTFSKNSNKCGGWWSSSKPYGLDLPVEKM